MMYSAYKLNKQPWRTPFPIWNQSVVPCPVLTVASWLTYRFLIQISDTDLATYSTHLFVQGFPRGASGKKKKKKTICQWRRHKRHEFHPQVRKIPWRRKWHPTPVFLPGESHVQRNLSSNSPWVALSTHIHWAPALCKGTVPVITTKSMAVSQSSWSLHMSSGQKINGKESKYIIYCHSLCIT